MRGTREIERERESRAVVRAVRGRWGREQRRLGQFPSLSLACDVDCPIGVIQQLFKGA
jgi:hypothetical protein